MGNTCFISFRINSWMLYFNSPERFVGFEHFNKGSGHFWQNHFDLLFRPVVNRAELFYLFLCYNVWSSSSAQVPFVYTFGWIQRLMTNIRMSTSLRRRCLSYAWSCSLRQGFHSSLQELCNFGLLASKHRSRHVLHLCSAPLERLRSVGLEPPEIHAAYQLSAVRTLHSALCIPLGCIFHSSHKCGPHTF